MNMFKYLLLSVVCGCIATVNAQEAIAAKPEDAVLDKAKTPVMAQDKAPEEKQPVTNEKELAEGQDIDFEEWAKSLEMTDEEKAQFMADMNEEIAAETDVLSQNAPAIADKADVSEVQDVQTQSELPNAGN